MEAVESSQQSQPNTKPSRGQRTRRFHRGGGDHINRALQLRPSSIAPDPTRASASSDTNPVSELSDRPANNSSFDRGRPYGRGRRGVKGRVVGNVSGQDRPVNGRQFGGQLTRQETTSTSEPSGDTTLQTIDEPGPNANLNGDAAAFVPGQPHQTNNLNARQKPNAGIRKRRLSKSQAPDIATRTHEDIDNGQYECLICMNEVRRNSKVWSCHTCWSVFHLTCIKKWAANEGAAATQQPTSGDEVAQTRQWRCPGCNLPKTEQPKNYSCWCEKEVDPAPLPGLPPHSCGNTCGKDRGCPHPCPLTCHAGPDPRCTQTVPNQMCFCGRNEVTKLCADTDYDGWSCGEVCGEILPCGEHTCPQLCHSGLCGACEFPVLARCYCGQVEKEILCQDTTEAEESQKLTVPNDRFQGRGDDQAPDSVIQEPELETWAGLFDCGNVCNRLFDCRKHSCQKQCHVQERESSHCPFSIDTVTHCPCGKTPLDQLIENSREVCTDAIPHCAQQCKKDLSCGHSCELSCHEGNCGICMKTVDIKCRCGRTTISTVCHQARDESPQCSRTCHALLNCGRHACLETCCPGERAAAERQNAKRKPRALGSAARLIHEDIEAEHICTLQCGRMLKCNTHYCQDLCHRGPCSSCREAIFEEVSCHCGRTVLQPPLPCGTGPPPCRYQCTRPKTCQHPQVEHNCHAGDSPCPPCPYLVQKQCMCAKKTLKNQRCSLRDVRCGEICGKVLKCGSHSCRKNCHRPGECEDADGQPCQQLCGKPKKACAHPDLENTCHAPFPCKEDKPCQSKIFITCKCQALKQESKCGASKSSEGNGNKILPCNEECARLERNRRLAQALNIDQSTHVDGGDHIPYSSATLDLFAEHVQWAQDQEREFRVFADSPDEKRLRFKPMRPQQRAFIHALAEDFGFDSEGMDPEPHRHVMIWKTPRFVSSPRKTLADALRIRLSQRKANASANVSDAEDQTTRAKATAFKTPFNGFVISKPRFGLTVEELRSAVKDLGLSESFGFEIVFLPNEEVVLKAISQTLGDSILQQSLQSMKYQLIASLTSKGYGVPELCAADSSNNVLRRESDQDDATSGWSKVAAKKAAPKMSLSTATSTSNNTFSALGSNKVTFTKKQPPKIKPKKEAIVDDWEAAEQAEEVKERLSSGDDANPQSPVEQEVPSNGKQEAGGAAQSENVVEAGSPEMAVVEVPGSNE